MDEATRARAITIRARGMLEVGCKKLILFGLYTLDFIQARDRMK
jgi:hypothetical protein